MTARRIPIRTAKPVTFPVAVKPAVTKPTNRSADTARADSHGRSRTPPTNQTHSSRRGHHALTWRI